MKFPQDKLIPLALAGVVFLFSLAATWVLWRNAEFIAQKGLQREFEFRVRETTEHIAQHMLTYRQVLRGTKGLTLDSLDIPRHTFAAYVKALRLNEAYPGIQGIGISELVPAHRKAQHIARIRSQGFPDYTIYPAGERPFYTAITQIEPFDVMNQRAFGFDMFSEPIRRAAMEKARDSGHASVSGKVTLVQEGNTDIQAGFLMYLPVYRYGKPIDTLEERRANLAGWVYAPFRMNDFMAGVGGERAADLDVDIYDGATTSREDCLYGCDSDVRSPLFESMQRVTVVDHPWTMKIRSTPLFEARINRETPKVIAIAGVGASGLLALLIWILATGRSRAIALAMSMTDELRTSELRWRYALEGSGDGVWDWNVQTGEVIYSRRWKTMLGYGEDDIRDNISEWERLLHPSDKADALQAVHYYLDGKSPSYIHENRLRCKDGSWKWILSRGIVVSREEDGKPLRFIGTHTDIADRKRQEHDLQNSYRKIAQEQHRMAIILQSSSDAFVAIDTDGRITDWNSQSEKMFGWRADEAIGKNLSSLIIPEEQREAHNAGLARFKNNGTGPLVNSRIEMEALHRSGRRVPIELAISAIRTEAGYTANAFIQDITARKEAQEREAQRQKTLEDTRIALQRSQKLEALGKLTGGVAHDFNNALQIISGNIQLLLRKIGDESQRENRLQAALNAVDRGAKLSAQLLAFARRQPLQPSVLNMRRIMQNMDELLRRVLGEPIEVKIAIADDLGNTLVDPSQLENVILNLAINARDAMKDGGKLTIELDNAILDEEYVRQAPDLSAGQYVMLVVSDTGCGMAPEVLERAFEPFFTTKAIGEGTGLGLSMAYGFVKQSGGHIQIHSEAGHGTTVRIYLPRSFENEENVSPLPSNSIIGGSETVLVVEDDLAVQETAVAMLSELGYRVMRADSAESALAIIQSGAPVDLLFSDVVMPGALKSPDMAKLAKAILPHLAVLFTSGYTQNSLVHGGRLDAGVQLLSKPYRREQLAWKIRQMLDAEQQTHMLKNFSRTHEAGEKHTAALHDETPDEILVVEDNEEARIIVCELLDILGYQVKSVSTAEQALSEMHEKKYGALLTDIVLPGMNGVQLAESVRQIAPGIKVVFVTGYGHLFPEIFKEDTAHVLKKPYSVEELQAALA